MSQQYIFTIEGLTRIYEQKEVLHNIWLSFFPGAKIGVLGNNGAGKSTLLRIMAGEDADFMGTARLKKWKTCWLSSPACRTRSTPETCGSLTAPSKFRWTPCGCPRAMRRPATF